ncbi:DUF3293 domain-containing protein [Massilia sp. H-1]|nr:DUF3293 domain-containing protein [Massilia sp. H-1]
MSGASKRLRTCCASAACSGRRAPSCDPKREWPSEPSFLVRGLSLEDASALGRQLRQNAIVWCGADLVPQLILLR